MEKEMNKLHEELQDALSLVILLENDCESQQADEVHQRTIHIIHEILKSAANDLENYKKVANANE